MVSKRPQKLSRDVRSFIGDESLVGISTGGRVGLSDHENRGEYPQVNAER
jgi:hypothetical protein